MIQKVPAPWRLRGNGYILVYRFNNRLNDASFPDYMRGKEMKGFGAVMAVDYLESDAGPYRELLIIPGTYRFREGGVSRKTRSISNIYVSTMESVENGRMNWGIPKERADFDIQQSGKNRETFQVFRGDDLVFQAEFGTAGPSFPAHTLLLPNTITQVLNDTVYTTRPRGRGWARVSNLEHIRVNADHFPDINPFFPLYVFKMERFTLTFPEPNIQPQTE